MIEKVSTFKDRLNEALIIRDVKPVDLARGTGISESTISQYRSGYAEPKEERLRQIANYLDINPTWLLGLNVYMDFSSFKEARLNKDKKTVTAELTDFEYKLISRYRIVDETDKKLVLRILDL